MKNHSDSPNRTFQVYTSRKRKHLDLEHSDSNIAVSHGSLVVTSAKESNLGEVPCLQNSVGFNSSLNNSNVFAPKDFPSRTPELSGIICTTSQCQPTETHLRSISTGNHMMESLSALKAQCTNHTMPNKPKQSLSTFESVKIKTESGNSCAKDTELRDQRRTSVAQKPPSSCEKFDQINVAMDHPSLRSSDKIQRKEGITSYKTIKHDVQDSTKAADISSAFSSHSSDNEIKSVVGQLSPSIYESLWDGMIQLSSSVKVSVIAFFKSGEKIQDITWPKIIEIKGKVKLDAFEKFLQELPYSQHRSLMVISLCWKVGSSKAGLKGMKEVAKSFEVSQKVGFAEICGGSGLYVCPRSEAVITILAKYGFFKGLSAVDTNQDSLMGCIVWRRNPLLKNSNDNKSKTRKGPPCASSVGAKSPTSVPCSKGHQATPYSNSSDMISSRNTSKIQSSIEKIQEIRGTSVKTQDVAAGLPSRCGHAEITGERVHPTEAAMPKSPFKPASTLLPQSPQITPIKVPSLIACQQSQAPPLQLVSHEVPKPLSTNPEIQQHVQPITDSHSGSLGVGHPVSHYPVMQNFTLAFQPNKTDLHRLPLQSLDAPQRTIHSGLAAEKNHMVEAFSGSMTQQKYASRAAESSELQQTHPLLLQPDSYGTHRPVDKDDLPEFDFSTVSGAEVKPNVHPLNKEIARTFHGLMRPKLPGNKSGGQFQQPSHSFIQVEAIKPRENVVVQGNFTNTVSKEIMNPVSHCNTATESSRNKDGIDDEDMPEWHFPELDRDKLHKSSSIKVPLPSLKTLPGAEAPLGAFLPITLKSHSPPKIEGFIHEHHPHMPPRCSNSLRDQGLFPRHRPPVPAEQGLFPRHRPPAPAEQGFFPRHHPPALADKGLYPRHPPPVLADQGLFPRHRPHVLADQGLFPRHPPPVLADQGFVPQRPSVLADQGFIPRCPLADPDLFPRHPPCVLAGQGFVPRHPPPVLADQGFIPRHPPRVLAPGFFSSSRDHGNNNGTPDQQHCIFGQRPDTSNVPATSGHIRPSSSFAPPGAWRPTLLHPTLEYHHYGSERSDGLSGSPNIPGHHPSFGNAPGSRPTSSGHR